MRKNAKRWIVAVLAAAAVVQPVTPLLAQFSDSYNFLKAVKDRDGNKATEFLSRPGTVIVNTRDNSTGESALHFVTERRDVTWMRFLMQKGANPDAVDKKGVTPLMQTVLLRFYDGAKALIAGGAKVDATNRSGETALIRAVQLNDPTMARILVAAGANPDHTDSVAGQSARDYASRDGRNTAVLQELTKADDKPKAKIDFGDGFFGPKR